MSYSTLINLTTQKRKLTIILTVIIFFGILIIEAIFLFSKYFLYQKEEIKRLENQIINISKNISTKSNKEEIQNMKFRFAGEQRRFRNLEILIIDDHSQEIWNSSIENSDINNIIKDFLINSQYQKSTLELNGNEYIYQIGNVKNLKLIILSQIPITLSELISDFLRFVLLLVILAYLFYYLSYRFISYIFKPVEENIRDMEQFIYNAGHELRTPLSVIKSSLQLAILKKNYKSSIQNSIYEIDRMNGLIQSLINLSTINSTLPQENININQKIKNILTQYESQIQAKKIQIIIIEKSNIELNIYGEYFDILFGNILKNAIKYNKDGGQIKIIINAQEIIIKDTGIGIKSENINKVFDRFFQDTDARNQDGFGIGLSLVKKIADLYGWEINLESKIDVGTTIKIKI